MPRYKVISRLRHDGDVFEPGSVLTDISEEAAAELVSAGVLIDEANEVHEEAPSGEATAEQPAAPEEPAAPAAPEAPATANPLDESVASVDEQLKDNVQQDLADSAQLDQVPGSPVDGQPSPDDVAETAAQVE